MPPALLFDLSRVFAADAHHVHDVTVWDPDGGRVAYHDERTGSRRKLRISEELWARAWRARLQQVPQRRTW